MRRLSPALRAQKPSQSCWIYRCSTARGPRGRLGIPLSESMQKHRQCGSALSTGHCETHLLGCLCFCSDPEAAAPAKRVIEDPEGERPCTKVSNRKGLAVRRWARTSAALGVLLASVTSGARTPLRAREPRRLPRWQQFLAHTEIRLRR